MTREEDKQEERKLEFTPEGYISLHQARVLALQHVRDKREVYGRYGAADLVWDVVNSRADPTLNC